MARSIVVVNIRFSKLERLRRFSETFTPISQILKSAFCARRTSSVSNISRLVTQSRINVCAKLVFMALIPLFSVALLANAAFGIAIVTIFTSSGELLILIAAIAILDKQKKDIHTNVIKIGGDKV